MLHTYLPGYDRVPFEKENKRFERDHSAGREGGAPSRPPPRARNFEENGRNLRDGGIMELVRFLPRDLDDLFM